MRPEILPCFENWTAYSDYPKWLGWRQDCLFRPEHFVEQTQRHKVSNHMLRIANDHRSYRLLAFPLEILVKE